MKLLIISKHVGGAFKGEFYYPGEWVRTFDLVKALKERVDVALLTPRPAPQHRQRFWDEFGETLCDLQVKHYFAPTYVQLGKHGGSFRLRMFIKELQVLLSNHFDIIMYMQFGPSLLHKIPNRSPIVFCSCHASLSYEGKDVDNLAKADWSVQNTSEFQLKIEDRVFNFLRRHWGVQNVPSMCQKSEAVILWHPSAYELLRMTIPAAQNLFFIPKGVDIQASRGVKSSKDLYDVLFVGAIMERKGISSLLDAFRIVNRELPTASLAIVGSGPARIVERMLNAISEYKINAEYLGSISYHKRWSLFHQSSIFCLPSLYDTYPAVILEAMACGLPVITTNVVDTRVEDGITGFLVPPHNPEALASKIVFLLKDSEVRIRLGQEARKVAERYDWNIIADQIIRDVLKLLVHNCGSGETRRRGQGDQDRGEVY